MKNEKSQALPTVPNSFRNIVKKRTTSLPLAHIYVIFVYFVVCTSNMQTSIHILPNMNDETIYVCLLTQI